MMIAFVRLTAALLILAVSLGCTTARPAAVAMRRRSAEPCSEGQR